jgi:hypothetical protein
VIEVIPRRQRAVIAVIFGIDILEALYVFLRVPHRCFSCPSGNQLHIEAIDLAAVATRADANALASLCKLLRKLPGIERSEGRLLLAAPALIPAIDCPAWRLLSFGSLEARQHEAPHRIGARGRLRWIEEGDSGNHLRSPLGRLDV